MTGTTRGGMRGVMGALLVLALLQPAWGEESWQQGFEATCSKSSEAMDLSVQELRALLDRCAELQKVIEKQEVSLRKVYLKRLQLCRNLYAYVLEHKEGAGAAAK